MSHPELQHPKKAKICKRFHSAALVYFFMSICYIFLHLFTALLHCILHVYYSNLRTYIYFCYPKCVAFYKDLQYMFVIFL